MKSLATICVTHFNRSYETNHTKCEGKVLVFIKSVLDMIFAVKRKITRRLIYSSKIVLFGTNRFAFFFLISVTVCLSFEVLKQHVKNLLHCF